MDIDAGKTPDDRYFDVENEDFREYRMIFNKGGDFVIYSDIQWHPASYSWDI